MSRRLLGLAAILAQQASANTWTQRALGRYHRARCGGDRETCWHGKGTLQNTMSGHHIADVESVELTRSLKGKRKTAYSTERLVLYRHPNGTLLTSFGKRPVPPLRYKHHVGMTVEEGKVRLAASEPDGREVASATADGTAPRRYGLLGRAYELYVRVPMLQSERAKRNKKKPAIGCREEYHLTERGPFGLRSTLFYRRTGRCPSWYGQPGGTCTLELHARPQRMWAFWKRGRAAVWQQCQDEADAAVAAG